MLSGVNTLTIEQGYIVLANVRYWNWRRERVAAEAVNDDMDE